MATWMILKRGTAILLGTALIGFGINYLNIANNLAEGGVTGLSILIKLALDVNPGLSVILINIPLFVLGYAMLGARDMAWTIYGTLCLSGALWLFDGYRLPMDDLLLTAAYAGACMGLGLGVIFRNGGTTGGVDIIARIVNKRFGIGMGVSMFYADLVVMGISLIYLTQAQVMYTLVAVFIGARVVDVVQQGAYRAKAVTVVSECEEKIAEGIMKELNRGVTIMKSMGGYTRKERGFLYVVCSRSQIVRVKNLIYERDPRAFVTVTDVHEVIGEGFRRA